MDVVFSVCIDRRGAVGARVWGSVSVSSCRCCKFVSCVHPVAVLNAAFCMTCSLLMLVEDERGDHMEVILRSHDCLIDNHEYLLLFIPSCCCECSYHL